MRIPIPILILILTCVLATGPVSADPGQQAGAAAYAVCASCHGAAAEGNAELRAPRLNHLDPTYLAAQLDKFRRGIRGGEGATPEAAQMVGMAGTLADEQAVRDVAAYVASLDSSPPRPMKILLP